MQNQRLHSIANPSGDPVEAQSAQSEANRSIQKMKKLSIAILALVLVAAMCAWLTPKFQYRRMYFDMINEVAPEPFTVVQMDDSTAALIEDIQTNWIKFNSLDLTTLPGIGLDPSVSYVVQFLNYRPQDFFLTKEEMNIGEWQALLLLPPIDGSIHLSKDGQVALIRHQENAVTLYENKDGKILESLYLHSDKEKSNEMIREFVEKRSKLNQ